MSPNRTLHGLVGISLLVLACERRPDGTMGLTYQISSAVESTADQPPVAVNPVSPMQYPQALLDQGIEVQRAAK